MKKRIFLLIVIIILISVFILLFNNKSERAKIEIVNNDNVTLKIDNSSPLSDELGIKKTKDDLGYTNFSIKSSNMSEKNIKYEIYVKQINSLNSINENYIKLYLSEKNTHRPLTKVLVFNQLKASSFDTQSRRLYVGTIKKNEVISLNLRMWLSDNYTVSNEKRNFEIVLGVHVID